MTSSCLRSTYCKVKKANALAGKLSGSFTYMDKDMFKQLFVAIAKPHLEYRALIWNPHWKERITIIENVQRRAKKTRTRNLQHVIERKVRNHWSANIAVQEGGDMIEVYKISHGFYDEEITKDFLQFRSNEYTFRGQCFNLPDVSSKKEMQKFYFDAE